MFLNTALKHINIYKYDQNLKYVHYSSLMRCENDVFTVCSGINLNELKSAMRIQHTNNSNLFF